MYRGRQQMYKKRLTKWGFQKNFRSSSTPQTSSTESSCWTPPEDFVLVPMSPVLNHADNQMLILLTNIRTWSLSFYESVRSRDWVSTALQQSWPEQSEEMNFTFKLVIEMFERGHGSLAGRMARKAFLLAEDMLLLEGPALIWNLLEVMHSLMKRSHVQLFRMLLFHLISLVNRRMPAAHPLATMLRALREFVASSRRVNFIAGNSSSESSSSSTSDDKDIAGTIDIASLCSEDLSLVLERAWILNAEILFSHFDHHLFHLYCRIHWDSCTINPPSAILGAAKQWVINNTSQKNAITTTSVSCDETDFQVSSYHTGDKMLRHLLAVPKYGSLPASYERLRKASMAVLQDQEKSILGMGACSIEDTSRMLGVLAGLVTAKTIEEWPQVAESLVAEKSAVSTRISRLQAGHVANALRTIMDLELAYKGNEAGTILDTVERNRAIVALREYAHAETDPRVVREMWLLKDALIEAGVYEEANAVDVMVYRRLERYVHDVPQDAT